MEQGEFNKEEYLKFLGQKCHASVPKIKIKGCYGSYDYYKYYRKNRPRGRKWALDDKTYYRIIRTINNKIIDCLIRDGYVDLPLQLGRLEFRTVEHQSTIKDNKLVTTRLVDWNETMRLWFVDEEAREKKIVLKDENPTINFVRYSKKDAKFHNQDYYEFRVMRPQLRRIKRANKEGKLVGITFEDPRKIRLDILYHG